MPRKYDDEFRVRAVTLVRSGQAVSKTTADLGITATSLHGWVRQDRIDRGEVPGISSSESRELRKAKRRIGALGEVVEILRRANAMLSKRGEAPTRVHPVIDSFIDAGFTPQRACLVLGVSGQGYDRYRSRPIPPGHDAPGSGSRP